MDLKKIIDRVIKKKDRDIYPVNTKPKTTSSFHQDIYFTSNFKRKAEEWGLTEDHARFVFIEGDTVKENMKVATYKGQEIGIYVFRDRLTNQPVITSIWKRKPPPASKTRR
jgi:hypothetical protein